MPSYKDQLYGIYYDSYIKHHGIKGQKWGVRRFQNADGSYTDAGKKRYSVGSKIKTGAVKTAKAVKQGAQNAVDKWNNMTPVEKSKVIYTALCYAALAYRLYSGGKAIYDAHQYTKNDQNTYKNARNAYNTGRKATSKVVNDYAHVKVTSDDVVKAKERLDEAMKAAAAAESRGGMSVEDLNRVKEARDAYRAMKDRLG